MQREQNVFQHREFSFVRCKGLERFGRRERARLRCSEPLRSSGLRAERRGTGRGVSSVSSSVALSSPPKIVTATGCRISRPGCVGAEQQRQSARSPADSAVISTGVSRSRLPRTISRAAEGLALVQRQIDVVADLQDAVAGARCRQA